MFAKRSVLSVPSRMRLVSILAARAGIVRTFGQASTMSTVHTEIDSSRKSLIVQSEAGGTDQQLRFPFAWLRDNCQCDQCFHPVSKARLFLIKNLDPDVVPAEAQVTENGNVRITWPDEHRSIFELDWLKQRKFSEADRERRLNYFTRPPLMWNADLQKKIPRIDYDKLMTDKQTLHQWLVDMEQIGLTLIQGAPSRTGVLDEIGRKVAILKQTHYGQTFTVQAKVNPSNVAYTSATLGLHTDLPQFDYTPGVQMLHCIAQVPTEGGDNVFSDGFYTSQLLEKEFPDYFRLLTTVQVDFQDVGTDAYKFHMLTRAPIIVLDDSGKPVKINYNNQVRDSVLNLDLDQVQSLYQALCKMDELLNDDKHCVKHKLREGEIACFHNYRVLHGRTGYKVLSGGERHLEGGYLDWDEMKSRRRVLEDELQL